MFDIRANRDDAMVGGGAERLLLLLPNTGYG
jgi:hypothetical protein